MRLIDADEFIKEIAKIDDLRKISTKTIGEALERTPTIEAVPVAHGYWTLRGYFKGLKLLECSVCGKRSLGNGNYCPNCGAKMRTK